MDNIDAIRIELAKKVVELEKEHAQLKKQLQNVYVSLTSLNKLLDTEENAVS